MKLRTTFLMWISNYIDKVTDIIRAKPLGDFHLAMLLISIRAKGKAYSLVVTAKGDILMHVNHKSC